MPTTESSQSQPRPHIETSAMAHASQLGLTDATHIAIFFLQNKWFGTLALIPDPEVAGSCPDD